jgi:hypothetical protein
MSCQVFLSSKTPAAGFLGAEILRRVLVVAEYLIWLVANGRGHEVRRNGGTLHGERSTLWARIVKVGYLRCAMAMKGRGEACSRQDY